MTAPTPPRITEEKILKNALEIIYHTGLLKNEVVELSIGDVMQNGSIVSTIPPLSDSYQRGFEKAPVELEPKARELLNKHINYLKTDGRTISPGDPLFPEAKTRYRYNETDLWGYLSKYSPYNRYERHREAGILYFCWELSKTMVDKQQIIDAAHRLSRYSNLKRTEKLVEEGTSRDPIQYEKAYLTILKAPERLIKIHKMLPSKVKQYLSELKCNFDSLFDRDRKLLLNYANKQLRKRKMKLVQQNNSLVIEKITEKGINLKEIRRKYLLRRRKFS